MDLQKRSCPIKIELNPSGVQYLLTAIEIGSDRHEFFASSHVGGQFALFIQALYGLYIEGNDQHNHFDREGTKVSCVFPKEDHSLKDGEVAVKTSFEWDNEGEIVEFSFRRVFRFGEDPFTKDSDPVLVTITDTEEEKSWSYTVDGRDLCYAAAKACTETLKKYGFYGYAVSTGSTCFECGDCIDLHMLLFLKARALSVKEPRILFPVDKGEEPWIGPFATDFKKELELLLFDM